MTKNKYGAPQYNDYIESGTGSMGAATTGGMDVVKIKNEPIDIPMLIERLGNCTNPCILKLSNNNLTTEELKVLLNSEVIKKIDELAVEGNNISTAELKLIFESPNTQNIEMLNLRNNQITSDALHIIKDYKNLPGLVDLNLENNKLSPSEKEETKKYLALKEGIGNVRGKIGRFEKKISSQQSPSLARIDKISQGNNKGSLGR